MTFPATAITTTPSAKGSARIHSVHQTQPSISLADEKDIDGRDQPRTIDNDGCDQPWTILNHCQNTKAAPNLGD